MGCGDGSCSACGFSCPSGPRGCGNASLCVLLPFIDRVSQRCPGCGLGHSRALGAACGPSGALPGRSGPAPCLAGDQYCGGRLDKPSGSFHTPNWPERDYPAGVTCSWHIVAPKNQVRRCHRAAGTARLPVPAAPTPQGSGCPGTLRGHRAGTAGRAGTASTGTASTGLSRHAALPAVPPRSLLCSSARPRTGVTLPSVKPVKASVTAEAFQPETV